MASTHTTLDAASTDRKARLAKLAAVKRKRTDTDAGEAEAAGAEEANDSTVDVTAQYLSRRNYDPETKGPKLGFENAPTEGQKTLEEQAARIAISTKEAAKENEEGEKPIDLFKLQPKKPNWDLKRDLDEKMKTLNVRTDNAIARLVRERIQNAQKSSADGNKDGEPLGMEGESLVEGIRLREREQPEDEDLD